MYRNIKYIFKTIYFILGIFFFVLFNVAFALDAPTIKVTQINSQLSPDFSPSTPVASYGNGQQQIQINFEVDNLEYTTPSDIYKNLSLFDYVTGKTYQVTQTSTNKNFNSQDYLVDIDPQNFFEKNIKDNIFAKIKLAQNHNQFLQSKNIYFGKYLYAQSQNQKFIYHGANKITFNSNTENFWQEFNYPLVKGANDYQFKKVFITDNGDIYGLVVLTNGTAIIEKLSRNGELLWQSKPIGADGFSYNAIASAQNDKFIYVGTNHGLIIIPVNTVDNHKDINYLNFAKANNILLNINDIFVAHNTDIYLATNNGLVVSCDNGKNFFINKNLSGKVKKFLFDFANSSLYLISRNNIYSVPYRDDAKTTVTGLLTDHDYGYERGLIGQSTANNFLYSQKISNQNKFVGNLYFSATEYGNHPYCFFYKDDPKNINIQSNIFYVSWYPAITQKVTNRDPALDDTSAIIANVSDITIDPGIKTSNVGETYNLLTGIYSDNSKGSDKNNLYVTVNSPKDAFGEKFDVRINTFNTGDNDLINTYNILLPATIVKSKDASGNDQPIYDDYGNLITLALPVFGVDKKD